MCRKRLLILLLALGLVACGSAQTTAPTAEAPPPAEAAVSGPEAPPAPVASADTVQPRELAEWLQRNDRPFLLDVREPFEVDIAAIPGTSLLIPLGELPTRLNELDPQEEIVVYCRSGNRSQQAARLLREAGFRNVRNLEGGILGWSAEVDPAMPTY